MMGPTHRCLGALCGIAVASSDGQPWSMVAMSGLVASATSHGWASPDVDQTGPWVTVRQALPKPWARVLNHRCLSHWWGLPAAAWPAIQIGLPVEAQWPATMLLVGWVSHLFGDLLFGELPVDPWGRTTVGLGLDTGGFLETGTVRFAGHSRRVIPFGPVRVLIGAGIGLLLARGLLT
jgi:hypothetical protein